MLSLVSIGCVAVEDKHILVVNAIKQAAMSRVGRQVHFLYILNFSCPGVPLFIAFEGFLLPHLSKICLNFVVLWFGFF